MYDPFGIFVRHRKAFTNLVWLFRQWGNPYFMVAPLSEISRRLFWHDKTTKKSKQNVPDHSKNIVDLEYHKDLGK